VPVFKRAALLIWTFQPGVAAKVVNNVNDICKDRVARSIPDISKWAGESWRLGLILVISI